MTQFIQWFEHLGINDVAQVGGKNASLGEMIQGLASEDVRVPGGFATTADAFREFLAQDGLADRIYTLLDTLNVDDMTALAAAGRDIRNWIVETPFPPELEQEIRTAYAELVERYGDQVSFAVPRGTEPSG